MKQPGYAIKDLEVLSGIKMHTIRIWEKRYKLLLPKRTETNIRFYDDEDLKRLLNISLLTKNGYKISKVASWSQAEIQKTVISIAEMNTSESDYIDRFMLLLIEFDNIDFEKLIEEILQKYELEVAFHTILFKLFERIGAYWQAGSIFPSQEHFVSNIIRQKLIVAIDKIKVHDKPDKTILFYLPENEWHEFSLLFYNYMAKKHGFNTIYLGQSVPFSDLKKLHLKKELSYIFISFINPLPKAELEDYLQQVKLIFEKQKVFITGQQIKINAPLLPRNFKIVKDYKEFKKFLGS